MAPRVTPVSRRSFLGTASGALLAAQVPEFPLPEVPGRKLGWAVVGLGRLAVNQILPALAKCRSSRLAGLVSGRPEKARHMAQLYGVETKSLYSYDSYDEMARNSAIDVVYVALPNSMHAEYTIRALGGGQARAVREAHGQHLRRVRADDRGGQEGQSQADDRLPAPLRAVQPEADPDRARPRGDGSDPTHRRGGGVLRSAIPPSGGSGGRWREAGR